MNMFDPQLLREENIHVE